MCEVLTVHSSSTSTKDDKTVLIADMTVSYGLIRETFTTLIRLQPCKKRIDVQYIDSQGPFKYLENSWSFWPVKDENACEVEFFINYEFRNAIFSVMMGKIFDFASRTLVDAFERRAGEISNLI
ncbi:MAG: coenzyme Q-binding protein [Candidatus Tokpelaia sp. JSC085]|nr:MAG: coenzyme Q-binding protein [Candidatus Tokpelaia sp. JSC085]